MSDCEKYIFELIGDRVLGGCLETCRDPDRLPTGVGIHRHRLDIDIAGGADVIEAGLHIRIAGEKVVLFHQEAAEVLLQLLGVAEVDLQLQNDTEDKEVGVPHCLLLINLPVQASGQ